MTMTTNLIMCTVRGVVKKTPFEQYKNVRKLGLIAINLDDGDELKWIRITNGKNEIVISTARARQFVSAKEMPVQWAEYPEGCEVLGLRAGDQ